jgi:predicted regulator of amino acid metabolism with ACT domain
MANNIISTKRIMINKANARIVAYVSVAAFILVFSAVTTKTFISQAAYQNKVIGVKRKAVDQLKADIAATDQLKTAYDAFNSTPQNVLGGNPTGVGPQDGNNAKIVLDALPSSYDFPGLTTSLEALLSSQKVKITSITGTDDEVAQSANQTSSSPKPVPIPFTTLTTGSYTDAQNVIAAYEKSIRPIQILNLDLSGSQGNLTLSVSAQTYYQPAKSLNISKEVVK